MAIERLEGIGKLKKSDALIGNRTPDLPACSIVPQPTALIIVIIIFIIISVLPYIYKE
jgi:hypothetical protein